LADLLPEEGGGGECFGRPQPFGFERLTAAMNAVGTAWIFALMLLINADIVGRELFAAPVRGTTEMVALSIVGIVFLQLAHTLWAGRLTRSEVVLAGLRRRRPRLAAAMEGAFHLTGAVLLGIIFVATLPVFAESWRIGEYVGAIGDFTAPTWPIKLLILAGSAATALQFLLLAWRDFAASLGPRA
jgi:TRAP-type mannitol/chloroaromatic compound transport system permease small subunit